METEEETEEEKEEEYGEEQIADMEVEAWRMYEQYLRLFHLQLEKQGVILSYSPSQIHQ